MLRQHCVGVVTLAVWILVSQPISEARTTRSRIPDVPTKPSVGLQLTLSFDKASYTASDPILLTLALQNIGTQAVWVTKRFFISAKEVPPQQRDVYLEATPPSGQALVSTYTYETGFPRTDLFIELRPGEEAAAEHQANLRYYFDCKEPGTYQVVAVYENVFGPELGLDTFRGMVRSAPASFTIEAAAP